MSRAAEETICRRAIPGAGQNPPVERRGEAYMKAVLMSKMPWAPRGRKMVAYGFSENEANDLVEFFKWVGEVDLNGFPPTPDVKR